MKEKIYPDDFFTESEELEQDLEDEAIIKQIQKEYSDYEGLTDAEDDLIQSLVDELFG